MSFSRTVKRTWNDNRLMSALIELTYACNLDCSFCYNDLSLQGTPMSFDQYRALLEDLAALSVLNVSLSGGEPLAHPDFFQIGAYARELGFVVRIKSNGHAIKQPIARRIKNEIDPFLIEVSIHGASAEVHDQQTRVVGSFDRLISNIQAMQTLGLRVKANSVLTQWNEHEVEEMLTLCDSLGVPLQIDPEVKPKDDGDQSTLALTATASGQDSYKAVLRSFATRQGPADGTLSPADERRELFAGTDKHCGAGSNTIAVDPFGNVLPCVQWRVPVGNLHQRSVAEIWSDSIGLARVRRTTKEVRQKLLALGDAGQLANFCPGAAHTYAGDPLAVYPPAQQRMDEATRERVRLTVL